MFQDKLYTIFSLRHYKITPAFLAINKKPQKNTYITNKAE